MPFRPILFSAVLLAVAGCSSQPSEAPVQPVELPVQQSDILNQLQGRLIGVPAGSQVELALLEVDRRDQPDRLLSSLQLQGQGEPLPFALQFNPEAFPAGRTVELRGRVTRAGQLIMRLPAIPIESAGSQALGDLRPVPAP